MMNDDIASRRQALQDSGYNVVNLHPAQVKYDLMTDSWTEILTPQMAARMDYLRSEVDHEDRAQHIADIFPFQHYIYVAQGRSAEAFFWKVGGRKDRKVIQNMLFPTTRQHLVMNRMTPVECAVDHVFNQRSTDLFRGNLDCGQLRDLLREDAGSIGYIYIEAENNAAGGYPVSMSNVREIRQIIADYDIKMVLDATRLMENCVLIQRHEPGYADKTVLEIAYEFSSHFDSMTLSLAKDFGITRGGVIATNDERLYYRAKDTVSFYGPGINATDKAMINAAMKHSDFIEQMSTRRVEQARRLHDAMVAAGLPVISPAAGHCVVVDVEQYMDIAAYKNPVTSFIAHVYEQSGVRGGMHVSGLNRHNCKYFYVRFAIPLCTPDEMIDELTQPFIDALRSVKQLPDMKKVSSIPGLSGQLNARYEAVILPAENTTEIDNRIPA